MEEHVIAAAGVGHRNHVRLAFVVVNRDMRDETGIEYLPENRAIGDGLVREAANPGPVGGPGLHALALGQRRVQASVRTVRRIPSISSNSF